MALICGSSLVALLGGGRVPRTEVIDESHCSSWMDDIDGCISRQREGTDSAINVCVIHAYPYEVWGSEERDGCIQ